MDARTHAPSAGGEGAIVPPPSQTEKGQIRYLCENTMTERPLIFIGLRECHLISHFENEL